MKNAELDTPFAEMSGDQLSRGIQRWLTGGSTDAQRDETVLRKVAKARERKAIKNAVKSQANKNGNRPDNV
jgi:hypothetical protein